MLPNIPRLSSIVARLQCRVNGHTREPAFANTPSGRVPIRYCRVCGEVWLVNHNSSGTTMDFNADRTDAPSDVTVAGGD